MFGFRRREWKHARREEIAYLKELVAVGCLLALIMGALGFLAERGGEPPYATRADPTERAPETNLPAADRREAPAVVRTVREAEAPPAHRPVVAEEPAPDVFDSLDSLDPLATPEVFDRFDAMDELGSLVAHVPSEWSLATQRRTTPTPRIHAVVDKGAHTLTLFRGDEVVRQYGIAVGKNPGDKARAGDNRTPEGTFPVQQVHNAAHWVHDFGDGKGVVEGAYGPLFIRLGTPPWKGIGIHGTHDPLSIGTNATEGCVRMRNDELLELAEMLEIGTPVTILPN